MTNRMTDEDKHQWQLLHTATGEHHSGRVRYAAAMHLFHRGMIDADMLEAFRVCAKRDDEYPESFKIEMKGQR